MTTLNLEQQLDVVEKLYISDDWTFPSEFENMKQGDISDLFADAYWRIHDKKLTVSEDLGHPLTKLDEDGIPIKKPRLTKLYECLIDQLDKRKTL